MAQARTEFAAALNQIASEKGVDVAIVLDAIKAAALAAYKKDLVLRNEPIPEDFEEFTSEVNPVTGEISIFNEDKNVTPPGFARIAASIAKQVILQRLNEAERSAIISEYANKVDTVMSGIIQRQEGNTFFVDLGRAEGVLPPSEQVQGEMYHQNLRLKFLVKEIREGGRGSEVVVSRSDPNLVKGLFALEVPEIQSGNVEIKAIAREAGSRTKVAAKSSQDGIDPVGSLVGQKGVRVQAVMSELGEEKIDIISYSEDPERFIAASLSPAKDIQVKLNEADKVATVTVPQSQLSLAIGKGGQNVRLAAKLTGWKIDIEGSGEPADAEAMAGKPEEEKLEVGSGPSTALGAGKMDEEVRSGKETEEGGEAGTGEKKESPSAPASPKLRGTSKASGDKGASGQQPIDDKQIEEVPAETPDEGREKAETEATDPSKTKGKAVAEAVEENITQAEQDESVAGTLEEEEDQPKNAKAAVNAEADITEADKNEEADGKGK